MARRTPKSPFPTPETLDLSGEELIVSAPVTYEDLDLKGRPRHHLATTEVRIPIVDAADAPVVGTWKTQSPAGVSDITFRAHGGHAFYCERDTPYRTISIEMLAIGQDPSIWRRLLAIDGATDFTMGDGYPLGSYEVTNHPFNGYDQFIDGKWAQKEAFVREYNAKEFIGEEPDYLIRAERVRQEAARYLIIDGRVWTRTMGPSVNMHRSGVTEWSDREMKAASHHNLAGIFPATRLDEVSEVWFRHFGEALQIPAGDAPVIDVPDAFTWPLATAAALDYAFEIAIRANKRPTSEMSRELAFAVATVRDAFEAAFPGQEWLWRSHTYQRQWTDEIKTFETAIDLTDIIAAVNASIDAMPDLTAAHRQHMKARLAVHQDLAALEFARQAPHADLDEADLSALEMAP